MNNEIKEILEWLKDEDIYVEDYGYQYKRISLKEIKQLLDYITNLQQENEDNLKCINSLKEQLESVINEKEYYKQNFNDYKSRCEKAISKINDLYSYADNEEYVDNYCKDLLNILQNGSDSQ